MPSTRTDPRASRELEQKSIANFCTFSTVEGADGKPAIQEAFLRINYHCNQRCRFSWVDPAFPNLPHDAVVEKIAELGRLGLEWLSFTGGEPTLNGQLAEYVRLAKECGIRKVTLETNAVRLADVALCQQLGGAGLDAASVSLHAHTAEMSDKITSAHGTFEKTLRGVFNLIDCNIPVALAFVINTMNYRIIPEFVEFVDAQLKNLPIVFFFVAPLCVPLLNKKILPRFSDIKESLKKGINICIERNITFSGVAGICGIPPCILDGDMRYYPDLHKVAAQGGGEFDFMKTPECADCSFDKYCYGIRRGYVETYGIDEIHPI
ncbi:MAG: radical SAM protein [bacterium]